MHGEGVTDLVLHGVARHQEQRRRPRRHLVAHRLDEVVVDADIGHRPTDRADAGTDRGAEERDEEEQPEQQSPERSPQRSPALEAVELAGLRLLAPRPTDDRRVVDRDQLLFGKRFERRLRLVGAERRVELPDGECGH
jgi:hypothetical protein